MGSCHVGNSVSTGYTKDCRDDNSQFSVVEWHVVCWCHDIKSTKPSDITILTNISMIPDHFHRTDYFGIKGISNQLKERKKHSFMSGFSNWLYTWKTKVSYIWHCAAKPHEQLLICTEGLVMRQMLLWSFIIMHLPLLYCQVKMTICKLKCKSIIPLMRGLWECPFSNAKGETSGKTFSIHAFY